jgi:hypothetical protein
MVGGELSMWLMADEDVFGECGKIWEMMYLSEMLWNTEGYEADNRRSYSEIISRYVQPRLRDGLRRVASPKGYEATELKISGDNENIPSELLALAPDTVMADSAAVEVLGKYDRLVFKHSTLTRAPRVAWTDTLKIGEYVITYEDGTSTCCEVKYAKNALTYKSVYGDPMPSNYYRHMGYVGTWFADPTLTGKNLSGDDMTVSGLVFENPNPDKAITKIEYKPQEDDFTRLTLSGVLGLNKVK